MQPRPDLGRIELRDIDVNAQRIQGRDVKQFARGSAAAAGIDQLADVVFRAVITPSKGA